MSSILARQGTPSTTELCELPSIFACKSLSSTNSPVKTGRIISAVKMKKWPMGAEKLLVSQGSTTRKVSKRLLQDLHGLLDLQAFQCSIGIPSQENIASVIFHWNSIAPMAVPRVFVMMSVMPDARVGMNP